MTRTSLISALALTAATLSFAPAHAAQTFAPNYTFPDGSKGFALATPGEIIPCVYVGFGAFADAVADPGTRLLLGDGLSPILHNPPAFLNGYILQFAFVGSGNGRLANPLTPLRGNTSLIFDLGTRDAPKVYDLQLDITGPGDITSWAAFNPQPDPPGFWFSQKFGFDGAGESDVQFRLLVNGVQQDFHLASVPEPASWALIITGFGMIGGALRKTNGQRARVRFAIA